jgi:ATP-dependent DNA helicase RecQ
MNRTPLNILKEYWKHDSFRPMQEEIIQAVLDGKDALALLPTGGGKSICFQIPGLMLEGVCLVISPLIALMKDQAENLIEKGISVATIHSGLSYYDVKCILQDAVEGDYQFIYLSPERLETPLFKDYLPYLNISLLAIAKGKDRIPGLEKFYLNSNGEELNLSINNQVFKLLQQIRDLAHKFAISSHRRKRDKLIR